MVMSALCYFPENKLPDFTDSLRTLYPEASVWAPQPEGNTVLFHLLAPGTKPRLERSTLAPKDCVLPACETLFTFCTEKNPHDEAPGQLHINDGHSAKPIILFGCRPCDARGLSVLDQPYLHGPKADPYYSARRDALLVVTKTCNHACTSCFCHWVGSNPADSHGSDILFTRLGEPDGFILEAVSERGAQALQNCGFPFEDGSPYQQAMRDQRAAALHSLPPMQDISNAPTALADCFDDIAFWEKMTEPCLSCGACTYMCPTCYCFNISDEGNYLDGKRLRTWDTCMSALFTQETSGHNPRASKALRMRNRVSHKFRYFFKKHGFFSCNGCGRCISRCPVHLDIRDIVRAACARLEQKATK